MQKAVRVDIEREGSSTFGAVGPGYGIARHLIALPFWLGSFLTVSPPENKPPLVEPPHDFLGMRFPRRVILAAARAPSIRHIRAYAGVLDLCLRISRSVAAHWLVNLRATHTKRRR